MKKTVTAATAFLGCLAPLVCPHVNAQEDSPLSISGYVEAYYIHDFNNPSEKRRPQFTFSHDRTDAIKVNMALAKIDYSTSKTRASLGVAEGTYMKANYAAEPSGLQNIFEANIGLKISNRHELWVDIGVLPSHIGFESAIGRDNWTLTRSILADNSPYFETGAQVSYTSQDGKWFASALLLNGWQRIQRPDGNTTPALGHQLTYKPNDRITLNSSSFVGNDKSDELRQMRYFHNFYAQFQLSEAWSLTAAMDIGAEEKEKGISGYNTWFSPIVIARYAPTEKLSFAARAEYYDDRDGVIVDTGSPNGLRVSGFSVNMDYNIKPDILWRTEIRGFNSKDGVFHEDKDAFTSDSLIAVSALVISF